MRIKSFRIENFRNLTLAECSDLPDFIVICGGNGCGKTALLEALMTAKEHAGRTQGFNFDPRTVAADSQEATIAMTLSFEESERQFVDEHWSVSCPEEEEVVIEILRGGKAKTVKRSDPVSKLLSYYSREYLNSPGFFDYIDAFRYTPKAAINTWSSDFLSDEHTRNTLGAPGSQKFQNTKRYLVGLKMYDLQQLQSSQNDPAIEVTDSLKEIREFFDDFFSPMKFVDVRINTSPFQFVIDTPRGSIDIDDLSGGEKEVLNLFIRFHQLKPKHAVILFDEADAHLHPDLARRYLDVLRKLGTNNQLLVTTHSAEMMIGAGTKSLYTVVKEPPCDGASQFIQVTDDEALYEALCELMGSRGLVSFNQRIVFIEGQESSADRAIFERFYPPGQHNVSFVPAGNSATVSMIAGRVNTLLSSSLSFQQYYSIVDGDVDRPQAETVPNNRLFRLPVYHVENFLLEPKAILAAMSDMLGNACPCNSEEDIEAKLKELIVQDSHVNAYARATRDSHLAKIARNITDDLFQGNAAPTPTVPDFETVRTESLAALTTACEEGTWQAICKGRDVLRALAGSHQIRYELLRNCIMAKLAEPPTGLATIMDQILGPRAVASATAPATAEALTNPGS